MSVGKDGTFIVPRNALQSHTGPVSMGVPQGERTRKFMGEAAQEIRDERVGFERQSGGITPEKMQELVGRYLGAMTLGAVDNPVYIQLRLMAEAWPTVVAGHSETDEREFAAQLMLMALQLGHQYTFDTFQSAYDLFDVWLQNAITLGEQARAEGV